VNFTVGIGAAAALATNVRRKKAAPIYLT